MQRAYLVKYETSLGTKRAVVVVDRLEVDGTKSISTLISDTLESTEGRAVMILERERLETGDVVEVR